MGNCLFIRIMKSDGKILADFSDAVPVTHHLSGDLYYIIPTQKKPKKAVRLAEPEKETGSETTAGGRVVRIKVVMTKKELQEMVERGGITADELMICKIKTAGSGQMINCISELEEHQDDQVLHKWKPLLQSIPETQVC